MIEEMLHNNKMKPQHAVSYKRRKKKTFLHHKTRLYVHYYNTPNLVKHKYDSLCKYTQKSIQF